MQNGDSKRILIVEDALDIQFLLAHLLRSEGYQVDCAIDGLAALELLNSAEKLPGIILLDIMMPGMDGYQFREEQLKHERIAAIPVIVMTAAGDVQSKTASIEAQGFLKKPFSDITTILETVGRFFSN
jgi:CheY-like chemotaxis protein